ncbi:hypothetical protein FNV43_RR08024 [Rhamnella rubrinervis]|uniref:Phosphoglycerate mutase n=1 Tax=Rhamnella rubrinervis TaxID=2594499 RepID=A0A8K0MN97_9ROSA|nr:hypothetical protein FNV43_RR08024 [Rhamnella rubrinervis]
MNAVTLCNTLQLHHHQPISSSQFFSNPNSFRPLIPRRNPTRYSLVIETVEGQGQAAASPEPKTPSAASESVSRRLILLRHAKSSWEDRSLRDHDRPLSKAGQADAKKVSQKLQQLGWIPQLILSSNALRTRETLKIMQEQVREFLDAEIRYVSSFYSIAAMDGQTAEHLQRVICKYSTDDIVTVMCMGHNRGWEEAASMFTGAVVELKTCNAALLETTGTSWAEMEDHAIGWNSGLLCLVGWYFVREWEGNDEYHINGSFPVLPTFLANGLHLRHLLRQDLVDGSCRA